MNTKPPPKLRRVLIAHGVNLDLLGVREPDIYGRETLPIIEKTLRQQSSGLAQLLGIEAPELAFYQSNDESQFLAKLSEGWDGALINPGAWTHTSLALADRLAALKLVFVEVHLSNLSRRESYRHVSYAAPHAIGVCYGFGAASYSSALCGLYVHFSKQRASAAPHP